MGSKVRLFIQASLHRKPDFGTLASEGHMHKQCDAAKYECKRNIYEASDIVPEIAVLLFAAEVDSLEQLLLFEYVEP